MHRSSFEKMHAFRQVYLSEYTGKKCAILDVGSASFGGDDGYRPIFVEPDWNYTGLDVTAAHNVDLVVANAYRWDEVADSSVDIAVSGQAFEHIAWPWLTMMEIARVLRAGGLAAITAPSAGHVHRYPLDCWRYYPDGFPALAAYAGLRVVEQHVDTSFAFPESAFWGDVFVVLRRPKRTPDEDRVWRLRYDAALAAVCGLDWNGVPETESGRNAIAARTEATLRALDAKRVKAAMIQELLYHIWRIMRTPLSELART